jgi:hypothetical protein
MLAPFDANIRQCRHHSTPTPLDTDTTRRQHPTMPTPAAASQLPNLPTPFDTGAYHSGQPPCLCNVIRYIGQAARRIARHIGQAESIAALFRFLNIFANFRTQSTIFYLLYIYSILSIFFFL